MRPLISKGEKVSLGLILESDIDFLYVNINDPKVHNYLRTTATSVWNYKQEVKWVESLGENQSATNFSIVRNSDNAMIGVIGLRDFHWKNGCADIGYWISRENWGKGFTSEAVKLSVDYAFKKLNLRKLISCVYEPNEASIKVLLKNGFQEIGRYRKHAFVPGHGYVDEVLFELFNPDHA